MAELLARKEDQAFEVKIPPPADNQNSSGDGLRRAVEVEIDGEHYYFDSATDYSETQGVSSLTRSFNTSDLSLRNLYRSVEKGADERKDVTILFSETITFDGNEYARRNLYGCLPVSYDLSTLAAEEPGMESISLEYQDAD
ncbi:MAG: hypothetical protein JSW26_17525 [Desulfobacterales bacterium]|nr:MAG: hypothetical protein JSW26_17525 [Desulfobacterales bacterium]